LSLVSPDDCKSLPRSIAHLPKIYSKFINQVQIFGSLPSLN
jgi:hypothetical protein